MNESSNKQQAQIQKSTAKQPNKCHKCHKLISINPLQQQQQQEEDDDEDIGMAVQCVYSKCPNKNVLECLQCSELSFCRNCDMALCKQCCSTLQVLECSYCPSIICSQQCYSHLISKYFQFLQNFGLSPNAHESMLHLRKILLPPHLFANLRNIPDHCIPFHVCEGCKVQNCGCVNWFNCVNCRKYYCMDCEKKALTKCGLDECECRTCCYKDEWNRKCAYCNRFGKCGLIFCTKGHCDRHIVINKEMWPKEDKERSKENKNETCEDVDDDSKH